MPFVPDTPVPTGRFVPDEPAPTDFAHDPNLLHGLAHGGRQLLAAGAHAVGSLEDVGVNLSHALDSTAGPGYGGPDSNAQRLYKKFAPPPDVSDQDPDTAAATQGVSKAFDTVAGTGPLASTIKEVAPTALETATLPLGLRGVAGAADSATAARAAATERAPVPGGPPNPINEVHGAGYQFRPSDVQARNPTMQSVPGSVREALTSSPEQTQQIVRNNAALSTKLIGEDIGVPNATKLTQQHYAAARLAPGADYDRVGAAVGTMDKVNPNTVAQLRSMAQDTSAQAAPAQVRAQMTRMADGLESGTYTGPQAIQDISYLRTKGAYDASGALEDELGNQVQAKAPQLAGTYESARTLFAKIKNAEDSTTGGLIDAADYRRLAEKEPRLLTGNSRLVAQAGGEIPSVTALPRAGADVSPVKGTLYDTVANAAARGAAKIPVLNITSPRLQAKIAGAAPATGPVPTGPFQTGLPSEPPQLGDVLSNLQRGARRAPVPHGE